MVAAGRWNPPLEAAIVLVNVLEAALIVLVNVLEAALEEALALHRPADTAAALGAYGLVGPDRAAGAFLA